MRLQTRVGPDGYPERVIGGVASVVITGKCDVLQHQESEAGRGRTVMEADQEQRFQVITQDWANARRAEDRLYVILHDLRDILDDPNISPELRLRVQKLRIKVTHEMEPGGMERVDVLTSQLAHARSDRAVRDSGACKLEVADSRRRSSRGPLRPAVLRRSASSILSNSRPIRLAGTARGEMSAHRSGDLGPLPAHQLKICVSSSRCGGDTRPAAASSSTAAASDTTRFAVLFTVNGGSTSSLLASAVNGKVAVRASCSGLPPDRRFNASGRGY